MCRDFLGDEVPAALVDAVLAAAFRAPSAGNTAGIELLVLESTDVQRYWDATLAGASRDHFRWPGLLKAPVLVVPVVSPGAYVERYSEPDKSSSGLGAGEEAWPVPYWFVDGGASVMAMLLSAEALGLGALFFGQFQHEPAVAEAFAIPPGRRTLGTIALGYPAPGGQAPSASARRGRPHTMDLIHRRNW